MKKQTNLTSPAAINSILAHTKELGFEMGSEMAFGCLLKTLAASKPKSRFLELGTGTGLGAAWILDGMCKKSSLVSVDNDPKLLEVAEKFLGDDKRLKLVCEDGDEFVKKAFSAGKVFDFIFADTWAGKFRFLDETLQMLRPGGIYVIDDLLVQPHWPSEHPPRVNYLLEYLDQRADLYVTKMDWSSGIAICVKAEAS